MWSSVCWFVRGVFGPGPKLFVNSFVCLSIPSARLSRARLHVWSVFACLVQLCVLVQGAFVSVRLPPYSAFCCPQSLLICFSFPVLCVRACACVWVCEKDNQCLYECDWECSCRGHHLLLTPFCHAHPSLCHTLFHFLFHFSPLTFSAHPCTPHLSSHSM